MKTLEEVKEKLQVAKDKIKDIELRERVVRSNEEVSKKIIESIAKIDTYLQMETDKKIVEILNGFKKELASIQRSTDKTRQAFEADLTTFMNGIADFLHKQTIVKQNEIPESTAYIRSGDQIRRVIESYSTFTLVHVWKYDVEGNLTSVTTNKNDKTP